MIDYNVFIKIYRNLISILAQNMKQGKNVVTLGWAYPFVLLTAVEPGTRTKR